MDHALQVFGVAFTTLAGREIFHVAQKSLPSRLTMRDLIAMATDAAKTDGLLRSQNQEVRVLLDGYTTPLLFVQKRCCGASTDRALDCCSSAKTRGVPKAVAENRRKQPRKEPSVNCRQHRATWQPLWTAAVMVLFDC